MTSDPCILVVDDEPMLRDILSEWLALEGYRVLTAENGAEALRVLDFGQALQLPRTPPAG